MVPERNTVPELFLIERGYPYLIENLLAQTKTNPRADLNLH